MNKPEKELDEALRPQIALIQQQMREIAKREVQTEGFKEVRKAIVNYGKFSWKWFQIMTTIALINLLMFALTFGWGSLIAVLIAGGIAAGNFRAAKKAKQHLNVMDSMEALALELK